MLRIPSISARQLPFGIHVSNYCDFYVQRGNVQAMMARNRRFSSLRHVVKRQL